MSYETTTQKAKTSEVKLSQIREDLGHVINIRDKSLITYNIDGMVNAIIERRRITDAITIWKLTATDAAEINKLYNPPVKAEVGDLVPLRGNRRTTAAKRMHASRDRLLEMVRAYYATTTEGSDEVGLLPIEEAGKIADEILANTAKIKAEVFEGITMDQAVVVMMDHGESKALETFEVYETIRRSLDMGLSTNDCCIRHWGLIASPAGLNLPETVRALESETDRRKADEVKIKKARNVVSLVQRAMNAGPAVYEQLINGLKKKAGYKFEGKHLVDVNTNTINEISQARTADLKAGTYQGCITYLDFTNGEPVIQGGGTELNKVIGDLIRKGQGVKPVEPKAVVMSKPQLEAAVNSHLSDAVQFAFKRSLGNLNVDELRAADIKAAVYENFCKDIDPNKIKSAEVQTFVKALLTCQTIGQVKSLVVSLY